MYKCVFHPRTLLVTDKTIAFFVGRGHCPRCSPALTQTKISKARYRGESHRTVSGLALYFMYCFPVCLLYPIRPLFLTAWTASVIFSTGRVRAKRT